MARMDNMPMNMRELLDGLHFPVAKIEILDFADDHEASEEALEILRALPQESYDSMRALLNDMGQVEQIPGTENLWASARQQQDVMEEPAITERPFR
jgi:hypothetical protein